jgi:hypothetical protein
MPTCIQCKTDSNLLTYDAFSLCHHCSPDHAPVIAEAVGGVVRAAEKRAKARKPEIQLELLRDSIEHCRALQRYPELKIEGIQPARLMADLEKAREETVEQAIRDAWFTARERAKDSGTYKMMLAPYAKAVAAIQGLMDFVDDASVLDKAVIVLRAERDALVFETICRDAQLAEQQGKKARARDLYIEAAFQLGRDGTPDAYQAEKLELAEQQIKRLGGRP